MLVLSRKPGEKLHIGDNIVVTVLEVVGNRIRIGIEAPDSVRILRAELDGGFQAPPPPKGGLHGRQLAGSY